jgi:RNA polymerase sigma-70 factor (ECF subfamily)
VQRRSESELIADGRNGDRQALSDLFERHYRSSVRIARRILHSDDEALDAVQSAYLAAFQHLGSFRGEASFSTWITRIVKNECFIYLRQPGRVWASLEDEGGGGAMMSFAALAPTPEDLAWSHEIADAVWDAAETLPKPLKDVYTLRCVSGLCVKDAAKI